MKNRIFATITALILTLSLSMTALAAEQKSLSSKLVRLHVIANSDSAEDQALKLKVRDAVLALTDGMSEDELAASLPAIAAAADSALRANGSSYPVTVRLGEERYPTRSYDGFALPAGDYRSLRVEIGAASGENWWCVIFPPLCFASTEEFFELASEANLTSEEINFVRGDGENVQIRFRIFEVLAKIASIFDE